MVAQPKRAAISFHGGAGTVTGANFLLEINGAKLLVDCGLFQGAAVAEEKNYAPFPYDPKQIDVLFVTHAHLDHIGRIPKLVREGFCGAIYSTPPTRDLAELSLLDSLGVLRKEASAASRGALYHENDVRKAMGLWRTASYHQPINFPWGEVTFVDAGHILGSAMAEFVFPAGREEKTKIVFTGDLGNSPTPFLGESETVSDADYLVLESVYGDRDHPDRRFSRDKLEDIIEETMTAGGTLVVPAFSIERTQVLLYEIGRLMSFSRIPLAPVFLDSPLAIAATEVYEKYKDDLHWESPELVGLSRTGLFNFPQLRRTPTTAESKEIVAAGSPKIIIAGSGMSNGGRVLHHEKNYLPDPRNTLLLIGYQAAGSLGRRLAEGVKVVKILGEEVPVRARVFVLSGYSAHRDSRGLLTFVNRSVDCLKRVFVVMGEPAASFVLAQRIKDHLGLPTVVPQEGERHEVSF